MNTIKALVCGLTAIALCLVATSALAGGTTVTFIVNSTDDTLTAGTLRQAISDANNASGAFQVNIDIDLPDGSQILLTSDLPTLTHPNVQVSNTHPSRRVAVDGDQSFRVFEQTPPNSTLSVLDLEIRDGWMDGSGRFTGGACLYTSGRALLYRVRFENCEAINGSGAAVHAKDNLLLEDSVLSANSVFQDSDIPLSRGGAVYCGGTFCDISGSTFSDNEVAIRLIGQTERGGGAAWLDAEQNTVRDSVFLRNRGLGRGGALYATPRQVGAFVEIRDSLFRRNEGGEGGALFLQAADDDQTLLMARNSLDRNTVTSRGSALVVNLMAAVDLHGNLISENDSSNTNVAWGAVYVFSNSTRSTDVTMDFNTFVGSDDEGSLFQISEPDASNVVVSRLHANIFDQRASRPACVERHSQLTPQSGQFNVVSDDSCTGSIESGSQINVDPLLSEAVPRPDRTLIYPRTDSPAIDLVTSETLVNCSGQLDLGGTARPLDGDDDGSPECDAGALERNVWLFTDRFEN